MANRQKYTRAAIGHLCAHYAREKDKDDNYIKFGNQDIDVTRTHLNYNLAEEDQKMKQQDFINKRIKDLKCMNRKDVNVMITWVVTLPQEMNGKSDEEKERFFRKSYNFLKNRYGAENVISAYVHMDEGQPHMHFAFTPVMYDQKKGRYKFDAKRVGSRQDLQTFHKDFDKHLEREMGYKTGVINGITEINLSTKELKEVQKRMAEIDRELSRIHSKTPQKGVLGYKKDEVEILVKENKLLRQKAILVTRESEVAKETNKTIQREIEKIRTSASVKKRIELVSAINGLKTQLNDVMLENVKYINENANLANENMELREKVSSLETELNVLKEFFNKVIDFFRTQARDVIEKFKKYLPQDLSKRVDEALKQREHEFWREAMYVEPEFESQEFERDDYDEFER
jgi:predicted nuclease with TOPRIM domain